MPNRVLCQTGFKVAVRSKAVVLLLLTFLFIVTPVVGVCNCSMIRFTLLYVHSSIAIILMGKRELIALLNLSSWCLVTVSCSSSWCHGVVCGL